MQTNLNKSASIFDRIELLASLKGYNSVNELAQALGYASPEKIYRLKRDPSAKPSYDIINDFSNSFVDLNLRWFLNGIGMPLISNTDKIDDDPVKTVIGKYEEMIQTVKSLIDEKDDDLALRVKNERLLSEMNEMLKKQLSDSASEMAKLRTEAMELKAEVSELKAQLKSKKQKV